MANISGFSIDEFTYCCELIDKVDCVGWIELNISCPNVHGGGMSFGTSTKSAGEAVKAVRKVTTKPIIIKLTPNVTNITEIALACEAEGADGVSMINTPMGMRINLRNKKPILKNKFGGMSGDALLPIALRMVYQTYEKVKIPIVGMGGISSAENVIEMMLAGATAVGVGAANLVDPFISKTIIEELPTVMKKYGINDLSSIIGGAH
jgi:dihydroorotate dehydrogenase (NAD+) catalytic subunit